MNTKNIKQKLFSKKIFGVPAFLIALAIMSVGGMAIIASYGTSVATVTVVQGVVITPVSADVDAKPGGIYSYIFTITNSANQPITVGLSAVVNDTTANLDYKSIPTVPAADDASNNLTYSYNTSQTVVLDIGVNYINASIGFASNVNLTAYNITTNVVPQ